MSKERTNIYITERQKNQLEKRSKAGKCTNGGDYQAGS